LEREIEVYYLEEIYSTGKKTHSFGIVISLLGLVVLIRKNGIETDN
jgi:hypothetical protein